MNLLRICALVLLALAGAIPRALPARADDDHRGAWCRLDVLSVNFGQYNVFSAFNATATGAVSYYCSQSTPITITLSTGRSHSYSARDMYFGRSRLQYNLYQDASGSTVWGDGSDGSQPMTISNPPAQTYVRLPVYGILPARQTQAKAGRYFDRIVATIQF